MDPAIGNSICDLFSSRKTLLYQHSPPSMTFKDTGGLALADSESQ